MRLLILRLVLAAALALFAAGAAPALSSPFSVTRHVGVSLRRVWLKPGAPVRHAAPRTVPLRVATPPAYRRAKAAAETGYRRWLRQHPTETGLRAAGSVAVSHAGLAASDET